MRLINLNKLFKLFVLVATWLTLSGGFRLGLARATTTDHVVISEIQISGATATDEFVELYNPTETSISLTHFKLQKLTATGNASNLLTDFPEISIAPHSYLLIAHPTGYSSSTIPDLRYSTTSSIAKDNSVVLFDTGGAIIDLVGFGTATQIETQTAQNPIDHQSLERLPGNENGNGADTDNNAVDFSIRTIADPTSSMAEARPPLATETPNQSTPVDGTGQAGTESGASNVSEMPEVSPPTASEETPPEEEPASTGDPSSSETPQDDSTVSEPVSEGSLTPLEETTLTEANSTDQIANGAEENSSSEEVSLTEDTVRVSLPQNSYQESSARAPNANDLVINEFMPNPDGEDEWVEIKNVSTETLVLGGLMIRDGGTRTLNLDGEISPNGYRVFAFSSATLNNSGDAVHLLAPDESILDVITYGDWDGGAELAAPSKNETLARIPDGTGEFRITTQSTKNAANVLAAPQTATTQTSSSQTQQTTSSNTSTTTSQTQTSTATTPYTPHPTPLPSTPPPTPSPTYNVGSLLVSEIYPYPYPGENEWIEIMNPSDKEIPLASWTIRDARGTKTPLTGALAANSYLVIQSPRGHLNNNGDLVAIFDPAGNIIDSMEFGDDIERGEAYALSSHEWYRTVTPTPARANAIADPEDEAEIELLKDTGIETVTGTGTVKKTTKSTTKKSTKKKTTAVYEVSLEEARDLEKGTLVRTRGVVSVPPGIFGSRTFYVAGSGMQIYLHGITVPQLAIGDELDLYGKLGSTGGETRIVVSKTDGLKVVGQTNAPEPETIEIGEISDENEGWLATIEGTVTEKMNGKYILEDSSGTIPVVLKPGAMIDERTANIGDTVRIAGIISETQSGFRFLPRSQDDLAVIARAAITDPPKGRIHLSILTVLAGILSSTLVVMVTRKHLANRRQLAPAEPVIL